MKDRLGYYLKLYDLPIARFEFRTNEIGETFVTEPECNGNYRHLLPLNIREEPSSAELMRFITSRKIPRNRAYAPEILDRYGLNGDKPQDIIDLTRGVSFNDSYSIVAEGDSARFADYNLFDNKFDLTMQVLALTGSSPIEKGRPSSPSELVPSGTFPKTLRSIDGQLYLYKAGSALQASNTGKEPYSEIFSSSAADMLGIDHAEYWLEEWNGILCSVCPIFNTEEISFVPFYLAMPEQKLKNTGLLQALRFFENIGSDAAESFKDMLVFDAAIYNPDRHTGNYGVLVENSTGQIIGMAPLFDHNYSFWTLEFPEREDHSKLTRKAQRASGAFASMNLAEQAAVFGSDPARHDILERMAEFEMPDIPFIAEYREAHPDRGDVFNEGRIAALKEVVRQNARELMAAIDNPKHVNRTDSLRKLREKAFELEQESKERSAR